MLVPFRELIPGVALNAKIRHVRVKQLAGERGVRVMACSAKPLFNRGVYYPLASEILVAMTIEADVIGVQQPAVVG